MSAQKQRTKALASRIARERAAEQGRERERERLAKACMRDHWLDLLSQVQAEDYNLLGATMHEELVAVLQRRLKKRWEGPPYSTTMMLEEVRGIVDELDFSDLAIVRPGMGVSVAVLELMREYDLLHDARGKTVCGVEIDENGEVRLSEQMERRRQITAPLHEYSIYSPEEAGRGPLWEDASVIIDRAIGLANSRTAERV